MSARRGETGSAVSRLATSEIFAAPSSIRSANRARNSATLFAGTSNSSSAAALPASSAASMSARPLTGYVPSRSSPVSGLIGRNVPVAAASRHFPAIKTGSVSDTVTSLEIALIDVCRGSGRIRMRRESLYCSGLPLGAESVRAASRAPGGKARRSPQPGRRALL